MDVIVPDAYGLILVALVFLLFVCMLCCLGSNCDEDDREYQGADQTVARVLAEWEALVARAEAAALAEQATAAAAPPLLMPLPYFPYAATQGAGAAETVECSICLDPLRQWQFCSEVPVCRHVFHMDCLGEWARRSSSCPLCRTKIVPGSYRVAVADDMV